LQIIFVVATDDFKWCKAKFSRFSLPDPIVFTEDRYPVVKQVLHYAAGYNVVGGEERPFSKPDVNTAFVHFDLAVLSHVNYTVYDYGSFGLWGAYLSWSKVYRHY
jgi:hypothetical protein